MSQGVRQREGMVERIVMVCKRTCLRLASKGYPYIISHDADVPRETTLDRRAMFDMFQGGTSFAIGVFPAFLAFQYCMRQVETRTDETVCIP